MSTNANILERFPQLSYGEEYGVGKRVAIAAGSLLVTGAIVVALTAVGLSFAGQLTTFPQHIAHFFQNTSPLHIGLGVGIPVALTAGVIIIMARARYRKETLLKEGDHVPTIGTLKGNKHYKLVYISHQGSKNYQIGYIDKSQLDEKGKGRAYVYGYKSPGQHATVSSIVFLGTPFITIGTIVYHTLRAALIPFYIAYRLIRQAVVKPKNEQTYRVIDLIKEPALSLWRVVKAPFYAVAYMSATVYSFFNPLGGRKLGAAIERDWNEGVTLSEGIWSVQGKKELYTDETDGRPLGYFLAGCWQPISVAHFKDDGVEFESYKYLVSHADGYEAWRPTFDHKYDDTSRLKSELEETE